MDLVSVPEKPIKEIRNGCYASLNRKYRIPTMLDILSHNARKRRKRVFDRQKKETLSVIPQSELSGTPIEHLILILIFFDNLK